MKKSLVTLILFLIAGFVFAQNSIVANGDSVLMNHAIKSMSNGSIGYKFSSDPVTDWRLAAMQVLPKRSLSDFHITPKTKIQSSRQVKIGYPMYIVKPEFHSHMPVLVPDSTVKYHLKVLGIK